MKTVIVIESADELLKFCERARPAGDKTPSLPSDAKLIFEDNNQSVRLEASGFIMDHIPMEDLLAAFARRAGIKTHFT
jgi:hypothetical protein